MDSIIKGLLAFVTGGAVWEGFKFLYPELKRSIETRRIANSTLYKNLDPILKSANELYGKLESLAKEDFSTFVNPIYSNASDTGQNRNYIYYLFSQFWAQIEYLRLESQYTALSRIKKGNQLLRFIDSLESRKYRLLDRSMQRIIGECLITQKDQRFRILSLNEFIVQYKDPTSNLYHWLKNLEILMLALSDKEKRQRILVYGVIVAALIDHYDPNHKTVRRRNIYLNKLTQKSRRWIKWPLLEQYLPFIKDKKRYY
jgi:hypothetical protein